MDTDRANGEQGRLGECIFLDRGLCSRATYILRAYARRARLSTDNARDCEIEFVERLWRSGACGMRLGSAGMCRVALLRRCASNWVTSYGRRLARLAGHEMSWPSASASDGMALPLDITDSSPGPDFAPVRAEFWSRVSHALEELEHRQQELIVRHHLLGESTVELAAGAGCSTGAIEQALHRAISHLRRNLIRHGMDESEARTYLTPTFTLPRRIYPQPSDDD